MARQPYIDTSECVSCGNCESVCPAVFRLNETYHYAEVINPEGASPEDIQEAINYCPALCIHWQ